MTCNNCMSFIGKYNILKFRTDDGKDKRRYTKINDKIKHFL